MYVLVGEDCNLFRVPIQVICDYCTEMSSETAWSYDPNNSKCFTEFPELKSNRWRWSNGPYSENEMIVQELWAGAG